MRFHESRIRAVCSPARRGVWPAGVILLILVAALMALSGCATMQGNQPEDFTSVSYKALATARVGYLAAMSSLGDLYAKGFITESQKEEIVRAGRKFVGAYGIAAVALEQYERASREATLQAIAAGDMEAMNKAYTAFLQIVTPLLKLAVNLTTTK